MARTGMANPIKALRLMCKAGTTDYTVNGVTFFTDDQLQTELDRTREVYTLVPLEAIPVYESGTLKYYDYRIPDIERNFEEDATGSGWAVKDGSGNAAPTNTVNYQAGIINFAANTNGIYYYLDCRTYDLNKAAAAVWREKAGLEMASVDWSVGDASIKASQRRDFCLTMANEFDRKAGVQSQTMWRSDEL